MLLKLKYDDLTQLTSVQKIDNDADKVSKVRDFFKSKYLKNLCSNQLLPRTYTFLGLLALNVLMLVSSVLSNIKLIFIGYSPAYLWNKPLGHNIGAAR